MKLVVSKISFMLFAVLCSTVLMSCSALEDMLQDLLDEGIEDPEAGDWDYHEDDEDDDEDDEGLRACADTGAVQISTAEELHEIGNARGGSFCLARDIDLSMIANFRPIGSEAAPFTGILDGNNRKIMNLTINREDEDDVGLFGQTASSAVIKHLTLVHARVSGKKNVGIVVGLNKGTILDVHTSGMGTVKGSSLYAGAIAGLNVHGGLIKDSSNTVNVKGSFRVGGITGKNQNARITNSSNLGDIEGKQVVGGIVGSNYDRAYLTACTTIGEVRGFSQIGGISGHNSARASIELSQSAGSVYATKNAGGITGYNNNSTVRNSYSTVNVDAQQYVGGLIGKALLGRGDGAVAYSYAVGKVTGTEFQGGLIGDAEEVTLEKNYFDKNTTEQSEGIGNKTDPNVTGINANKIRNSGTRPFSNAGWDFATIWSAQGNGKWPAFSWQTQR